MGIKHIKQLFGKANEKSKNILVNSSKLTVAQVKSINQKRDNYLTKLSDKNDGKDVKEHINRLLASAGVEIYNAYLPDIQQLYIPIEESCEYNGKRFYSEHNIRYFKINKWITDTKEDSLEKLINVYGVLSDEKCNIALIFHREIEKTDLYLAVTNTKNDIYNHDADDYEVRLIDAIRGNFPGTEIGEQGSGVVPCLSNIANYSIASATDIPTEKSEKFISQTIEKLLDGIVPETKEQEYTIILLATPIHDIDNRKLRLGEIYTDLAPYAGWQTSYSYNENNTTGLSANIGAYAGGYLGGGANIGLNALALSVSNSHNYGMNFGLNFARSSNVSATIGESEGMTQSFVNFNIKHTLELMEAQLKRYEEGSALGLWDFAAYVLCEDYNIASNVAHSYVALTNGTKSYMSKTAINLWRGRQEKSGAEEILAYLKCLRHPLFGLAPKVLKRNPAYNVYPPIIDATIPLTGKELSYSLNFPRKSVAGLPILQCAEFGRNIITYDKNVKKDPQDQIMLGHIFHMNHMEKTEVNLSKKSLASHIFISGSTGSGKSNTVYQILSKAQNSDVSFLVIEPAKGEYKDIFGGEKDVSVYGTNLEKTPLLRLNPFKFPKDIHVLEHIDGLVGIFNVCWPMYAAMPAVLKNAIERSYVDCGWNLTESTNTYAKLYGDFFYPDFDDVARNIKAIIDSSEYDAENKGAYKGSLLTRLESLTNGINGQIFSNNEIADKDLFDKNVIVDLSRVRSSETKALLMGILVLKLQEYRMASKDGINQDLRHITVLEEAHNLLKKTSTEQPIDGGNLAGKSVEMLTNAIAEMRTYGEGFIIVDQAPALLDKAAIRNTNTKIIMRLPDLEDRMLVGKSANLNDEQISELSKLPCGVAAIYQNEWVQPVLCKVDRYDTEEKYSYDRPVVQKEVISNERKIEIAKYLSKCEKITDANHLKDIMDSLKKIGLSASKQILAEQLLSNPPRKEPRMTKIAPIMGALFPESVEKAKKIIQASNDPLEWTLSVEESLRELGIDNRNLEQSVRCTIVQGIITDYLYCENRDLKSLEQWKDRMKEVK